MQRHDAEVLLVGNELLRGERRDAHLAFVAQAMQRTGVRIAECHCVGDDIHAIAEKLRERMARTRVLVVTGGLGPTDDDVTREGVAEAVQQPLEFRDEQWSHIATFMASRGRTASEANRRQAHFPRGSDVLANPLGTAPGFALEYEGAHVFVLPGPPGELQAMFTELVLPRVEKVFERPPLRMEHFRTMGIGESQLVEMLGDAVRDLKGFTVSWLPNIFGVDIVLTGKPGAADTIMSDEAGRLNERLTEHLGSKFYEHGERPLAKVVGDELVARSQTVAAAESLTGGTVARLFTEHSGSSAYFLASTVAYADDAKVDLVGVRAETIKEFGAVSEEVCTEMAHGIRRRAKSTWGLATTGIAGPTGGTPHKPVGLTFIAVAWEGGVQVKRLLYTGDRNTIRERAAHGVIWLLHDRLTRDSA